MEQLSVEMDRGECGWRLGERRCRSVLIHHLQGFDRDARVMSCARATYCVGFGTSKDHLGEFSKQSQFTEEQTAR